MAPYTLIDAASIAVAALMIGRAAVRKRQLPDP
jgi:hypothetical protein